MASKFLSSRAAARWFAVMACLALCAPSTASGQSSTTGANFDVTASITLGCWINGFGSTGTVGKISTLDFGSTPARDAATLTANTVASSTLSLRCTPGMSLRIRLNEGLNAITSTGRRMRHSSSANFIEYTLCRDAACTLPIPKSDDITRTVASTRDQYIENLYYYARATVPAGLPPGLYTDQITVTLSW